LALPGRYDVKIVFNTIIEYDDILHSCKLPAAFDRICGQSLEYYTQLGNIFVVGKFCAILVALS
jgi:esterase/lipase superfamily enzyme